MNFLIILSLFGCIAVADFAGYDYKPAVDVKPFELPLAYLPSCDRNNFDNFDGDTINNFDDFVLQACKQYPTLDERNFREGVFDEAFTRVKRHNVEYDAGNVAHNLGINPMSDFTKEELLRFLTGHKRSALGDEITKAHSKPAGPPVLMAIPDCLDWREKGGVTPVKFQGFECGACWAFAATGAIEGQTFAAKGKLVPLSEQNLIDCTIEYGSEGCDGGFQDYAYEYVIDNEGIAGAEKYPYEMRNGEQCLYNETVKAAQISGYLTIEPGDERKMKQIIATRGPITCSINAGEDSFFLYKGGIYDDPKCNDGEVNHSILVVGYGFEDGRDFWIIKNSYSTKWGENGYMKLPRNENSYCGIASECSFPIV